MLTLDPDLLDALHIPADLVRLATQAPAGDAVLEEAESLRRQLPTSDTDDGLDDVKVGPKSLLVAAALQLQALRPPGASAPVEADRVRNGLAPLCQRLGMWELKRRLEDAAL